MTKLEKALKNIEEVKRLLIRLYCPADFGMENNCGTHSNNCEDCWNEEATE